MDQQRQDRRSQRTQQTLMDALIALLAVKHYDEISINDIIDRANVGRSTFYAHYQGKDDLLKSGFERVLDMLIHHISFGEADQDLRLDTTQLFRHAQGHYELYRTLVWGRASIYSPRMDMQRSVRSSRKILPSSCQESRSHPSHWSSCLTLWQELCLSYLSGGLIIRCPIHQSIWMKSSNGW